MAGRVLFGLVLLFFFPGVLSAFLYFAKVVLRGPGWLLPYLLGMLLGIVFDQAVVRKVSVLTTFLHELGHAFLALLFLRRVDHFVVGRNGGAVHHSGGFGGALVDDIIGLAPYTVPPFYFVSVLVRPFVSSAWFPWFDVWIGFAFGFHLWGGLRDIRWNWSKQPFIGARSGNQTVTDIARRGYVFSFIYIVTVTFMIQGILLSVMLNGYGGIIFWGQQFWSVTQGVVDLIPKMTNLVN
jgi:hypothetical protein